MKKSLVLLMTILIFSLLVISVLYFRSAIPKKQVIQTNGVRQPFIIIIKKTGKAPIATGAEDAENNAIWLKYADGKEELLITSKAAEDMKFVIGGIHDARLSLDKNKIYFISSAWATSDSIHVVEIRTKKERFLCPGNSLEVIQTGPYRGKLIVNQHRYNGPPDYGSYDHNYIIDENGKEIKDLGE